jgi:NADH:ubiquinone oxidoreductase subunit 3 (subunit A)
VPAFGLSAASTFSLLYSSALPRVGIELGSQQDSGQMDDLEAGARGVCRVCYSRPIMGIGPYLPVVVLMVAALGFALTPLLLARMWAISFSPNKPGPSKNAVYECGLDAEGDAWMRFKPGYYLYAILFLVFDVEAVFLLPFATAFAHFSAGECVAMLVFLLLLVEGLLWAYRKKVLVWR